jgi:hypothetical protein
MSAIPSCKCCKLPLPLCNNRYGAEYGITSSNKVHVRYKVAAGKVHMSSPNEGLAAQSTWSAMSVRGWYSEAWSDSDSIDT